MYTYNVCALTAFMHDKIWRPPCAWDEINNYTT